MARYDEYTNARALTARTSLICDAPIRSDGQYAPDGEGRCMRAPRPGHDRCSYHIDEDKPISPAPEVPGRCNALKHRARWKDPFVAERCAQHPVVGGRNNRCRMHSGQTAVGPTHHSYTHGRYSKYLRVAQAAIKSALAEDSMSLADLIASLRRKLKRLDDVGDPKTEPLRLALRAQLIKAIDVERRRLAERNGTQGMTVSHFHVLFLAAVEAIRTRVSDEQEQAVVLRELQRIIADDQSFGIYVRRRAEELGVSLDGGPEDEEFDPEEPLLSLDLPITEDEETEDDIV
jgi:hypothetical protein